jgi:hypothetical protein
MLTKKGLNTLLEHLRVSIPADLEKELLDKYANLATDDTGRVALAKDKQIKAVLAWTSSAVKGLEHSSLLRLLQAKRVT